MVHYANNVCKVVDCNNNQYHNKHFKSKAESFGLTVEKVKNKGYARTALGDKAIAMVKKYKSKHCKDDKNPFHAYRVGAQSRTVIKKSNKRFIAIDRALAARAEHQYAGGTLRELVEHLLESYVSEGAVAPYDSDARERIEELA